MPSQGTALRETGLTRASWLVVVAALVLASAGMAVISWMSPDLTRNDFERFDDLRRSFLCFGLLGVAMAAYGAVYWSRGDVPRGVLMTTAAVCTAAYFVAFPVGSKDVFGYAVFGKMLRHYGVNPLVTPPSAVADDPWLPFLGDVRWREWPVVYGPLAVWQAWIIDVASGGSLWTAVWLYKAFAAVLFAALLAVSAGIWRASSVSVPLHWLLALLAWNPLLQFESAGNAHNDVVMVLTVCLALRCRQRERPRTAVALLAAAFWYKWYSLLVLPAFMVDRAQRSWRAAVVDLCVVAVTVAAVGLATLWPLPGSLGVVVAGWLAPRALQGIYPNELSPVLAPLFWALNAVGAFDSTWGTWLFDVTRAVTFVTAGVAITYRQWRSGPSMQTLTEACCLWATAFVLLVLTMLLPWHLLIAIVLAVLCGREPFLGVAVVLTVLGLASYFLTFGVATVGIALVAGAVWGLRHRPGGTAGRSPSDRLEPDPS